jgi:N-acetylglutamate synthase-like GNAT family acetyltransferase
MGDNRQPSVVGGREMTIRPANEADFPSIRRLVRELGLNPMGIEWQHFLIAVDDVGMLIGMGQIKTHKDGSRELASIGVVPEHRGEGIARLIIEKLLSQEKGTLYLTCRSHNGPLYEKFGFRSLTDPQEMPAYFRRIYRLVHLFQSTGLMPSEMLVMVRR